MVFGSVKPISLRETSVTSKKLRKTFKILMYICFDGNILWSAQILVAMKNLANENKNYQLLQATF